MSSEKITDKDLEKSTKPEALDLGFITSPQFTALNYHFECILEGMKNDETLQRYRLEFSKLLQVFQSCYAENERKTRKIFELRALSAAKVPKVRSTDSMQDVIVRDLREAISNLQKNLDESNGERRELVEEIQVLKTTVDTQNKLIQVHSESLEDLKEAKTESPAELISGLGTHKDIVTPKSVKADPTEKAILEIKCEGGAADFKILRNNLEILRAGLKITRQKIQELKKEISVKDNVVKGVRDDLSATEGKLIQAETRISEIKKPMETELASTKTELEEERQKLKGTCKRLEEALALNAKLEKDISSKDCLVEELEAKVKELDSAKESAFRQAAVFERHLAESHRYMGTLKHELETLKGEILTLQRQISTDTISKKTFQPVTETVNVAALERTIESLKNHINSRDIELRQMGEELENTVGILRSHKREYSCLNKEKMSLESEKMDMKKMLRERNDEIKRLKEQLNSVRKEMEVLERNLQRETKHRQQAVDKKNKFHSMCNHLKMVNSEQKKENLILGKRQEYLVKILKEKDMEIERIVVWKRYIC